MTANALELISVQQIPRPRHRKLHMSQPTSLGAPHESEPKLGSPYIVRVAIQKQGTEKMCARTGFMLLWGVLLPTPMGLPGMPRAISGPWSGLWHPLGGSPRSRPGIRVGRSDWNTLAPSSRASSSGALNHVGVPDFRTVALSAANKADTQKKVASRGTVRLRFAEKRQKFDLHPRDEYVACGQPFPLRCFKQRTLSRNIQR